MFTGIVEEVGTVLSIEIATLHQGLTIAAGHILHGTTTGDSIAVNGACLTVTSLWADRFSVGVIPETLRRTNLGSLSIGSTVNLERSLTPSSRMGGHFVQGHVDGVGKVVSVVPEGNAVAVRIETAPELLRYVVEKGFVAVDGTSLTVTGVDATGFGIALIPYTRDHTAGSVQQVGWNVNLEVDILAKYVEKLVIH